MPNQNNTHIATASKGMSMDTKYKYQPEGKASFILNGVLESTAGDYPTVTNELGTLLCTTMSAGFIIIGVQQLDGDEFAIFSVVDENGYSEIGIFNQATCEYKPLVTASCLNFNSSYRIKTLFRIFKGCERVVYFTDGINPYKSINLDNIDAYLDSNGQLDCSKLEFDPPVEIPCLKVKRVLDYGGVTPLGVYYFRLRFLSDSFKPTNWFNLTKPTPIVDDDLFGNYFSIDGGVNIVASSAEEGSVPKSQKSIELEITSLDEKFKYYQIGVLIKSAATGIVSEAYILPEQIITEPTTTYVYTGPNPTTDIKTDVAALTVDETVIDLVEAHAQIDNRLFLANLSFQKYDYGAIQRLTEKITTTWITSPEKWEDINAGSAKSPKSYLDTRSFMRDEVYAIGIQGIHKKGWRTPVFHIPGRERIINDPGLVLLGNSNYHYRNPLLNDTRWDTFPLLVVPEGSGYAGGYSSIPVANVRHFGYSDTQAETLSEYIDRWKVFNTAIVEQYVQTPEVINPKTQLPYNRPYFPLKGIMAYHQSEKDYPDITDCDGNRIYPTGKIRHHRFPDTTLVPMYVRSADQLFPGTNDEDPDQNGNRFPEYEEITHILPIGLEFDLKDFLETLPEDVKNDFTDWEIVVAPRDYNKTVLDKGYIVSTTLVNNGDLVKDWISCVPVAFNAWTAMGKIQNFYSPKETFLRDNLNGTHYKNERVVFQNYLGGDFSDGNHRVYALDLSRVNQTIQNLNWKNKFDFANRAIRENKFLAAPKAPDVFFIEDLSNPTYYAKEQKLANFLETKDAKFTFTQDPLISRMRYAFALGSNNLDKYSNTNPGFVHNIIYASIKSQIDPYNALSSITYRPTESCYKTLKDPYPPKSQTIFRTFSGDTHISYLAHRLNASVGDPLYDYFIVAREGSQDTLQANHDSYIMGFYESEINCELRHESAELYNKYLKSKLDNSVTVASFAAFFYPKGGDPVKEYDKKEYFGYNIDYSSIPDVVTYKGLPITYDYCSKCDNRFPFRIRYSEKSFQDQVIDNYTKILSFNYTDLPGDTLAINNLFVDKNELYAHTPKALYFIPTRQQSLQTNENTIYIGTGEIFAVPPRRLASLNYAYGGSVDPWATVPSEFGTLFIDSLSGKVFMLQEGLKEISTHGMRNFFENELGLTLNTQVKTIFGKEYPFKSPTTTTDLGIGYNATFDTRHRRFILHKRDYEMLAPTHKDWSLRDDGLYFKNKRIQSLTDNYGLFRNKSWTLTYSLAHESWASFHSYFPDFIWNSESDVFSTVKQLVDSNFIYKHNKGNYTTYYNKPKADFILELVSNPSPMTTKKFGPIRLIHDTQIYDSVTRQFKDVYDLTFERGIFYASDISTGELNIRQQSSFGSVTDPFPNRILFERKGREVHMNEILDVVSTDLPIFTSEWTVIQPNYFIDKMVNTNAVDFNKSLFTKSRMVDQYMVSRLFFNPNDNIKITFEGLISEFKPFIR